MNALIVWLVDVMTAPLLVILLVGAAVCLALIVWMGLNIQRELSETMDRTADMGDVDPAPVERFVRLELGGTWCVMAPDEAEAIIAEDDSPYVKTDVYMTRAEFEKLPEFAGF